MQVLQKKKGKRRVSFRFAVRPRGRAAFEMAQALIRMQDILGCEKTLLTFSRSVVQASTKIPKGDVPIANVSSKNVSSRQSRLLLKLSFLPMPCIQTCAIWVLDLTVAPGLWVAIHKARNCLELMDNLSGPYLLSLLRQVRHTMTIPWHHPQDRTLLSPMIDLQNNHARDLSRILTSLFYPHQFRGNRLTQDLTAATDDQQQRMICDYHQ